MTAPIQHPFVAAWFRADRCQDCGGPASEHMQGEPAPESGNLQELVDVQRYDIATLAAERDAAQKRCGELEAEVARIETLEHDTSQAHKGRWAAELRAREAESRAERMSQAAASLCTGLQLDSRLESVRTRLMSDPVGYEYLVALLNEMWAALSPEGQKPSGLDVCHCRRSGQPHYHHDEHGIIDLDPTPEGQKPESGVIND